MKEKKRNLTTTKKKDKWRNYRWTLSHAHLFRHQIVLPTLTRGKEKKKKKREKNDRDKKREK